MRSARFGSDPEQDTHTAGFAERVRANQQKLTAELKPHYDFIVCGSGSSGSVVARRLAENEEVSVLLLEAGGSDDMPSIMEAGQWPLNLGSERDWAFVGQPNPHLNGRSIPLNMGKVLGGGSSINVMIWARGHKNDWDFFAAEARNPAWSYESVLNIYRRIEDWHGAPDPTRRGTGGPAFVQPAPDANPVAPAMLEAARSVGIPTFESQNGLMMEGEGGASIMDLRVRDGMRQSVFRSYVFPYMDRPNLTVLCHALVTRLVMNGKQASGVEIVHDGKVQRIAAGVEVVLSLGAIHTPKVLMLSGIGDQAELQRLGIPAVQHLPGVGANFQDHVGFGCVWEYPQSSRPRNNMAEATYFWKSDSDLDTPDLQTCQGDVPMCSAETAAQFNPPASSWTLMAGLVRPKSRGRIRLTGTDPRDPVEIEANTLAHPDDMRAAVASVELCREIGNSNSLSPFVKREVMPGNLKGAALENFIRDAASTYWHQACTAKMGHDAMSVVDGSLKVHGIDNLRIADGSIMPRVTTGNTMAPCVVIGERAAEILKIAHRSGTSGSVTRCRRGAAACPASATSQRFTELQERHAMTQTSEPGIKSERGEGERTRENGEQSTNAERHAISDNSEHLPFAIADLEANSGLGFVQHSRGIGVPAGKSATASRPGAWWDEIAGVATALLFAGLTPALVMAALWYMAKIARTAFAFTFAIALSHAVLLGLPLFLVFRSKGWINVMTCVVLGFAVGAVPAGVLSWPMQHPELHTSVSVDGVLTVINGTITAAGWISYVKPLIYFGSFGAIGGFAFWVALI